MVPSATGESLKFDKLSDSLSLPNLELVLSKGDPLVSKTGYFETILSLFEEHSLSNKEIPSAAISLYPDLNYELIADQFIIHADPVYLRPDQDRLLAFDFFHSPLTNEESDIFSNSFNNHFKKDGLELITPNTSHWYIKSKNSFNIKTHPLSNILGRNVDLFLPEGSDGLKWRSLINEIQMLFHSLPVNETRSSYGQWPVSGLWLSGGGFLPDIKPTGFDKISGNCKFTEGLQAMAMEKNQNNLIINRTMERAVLDANYDSWRTAILDLDMIIKNLNTSELVIYFCDGRAWRWLPSMSRRFWKRRKNFEYFQNKN